MPSTDKKEAEPAEPNIVFDAPLPKAAPISEPLPAALVLALRLKEQPKHETQRLFLLT